MPSCTHRISPRLSQVIACTFLEHDVLCVSPLSGRETRCICQSPNMPGLRNIILLYSALGAITKTMRITTQPQHALAVNILHQGRNRLHTDHHCIEMSYCHLRRQELQMQKSIDALPCLSNFQKRYTCTCISHHPQQTPASSACWYQVWSKSSCLTSGLVL